jgi:hypothetical protein
VLRLRCRSVSYVFVQAIASHANAAAAAAVNNYIDKLCNCQSIAIVPTTVAMSHDCNVQMNNNYIQHLSICTN